ncbi:hypothetical protein [Burkholderia sp. Ac-20365]|uniref:hypothetical protein n=1 Tax=Burkholderia sp. Ac-20365 TaxID=2703897 RepID=UPI00197B5B54|nr:hypothetical protein [Burkholderia sp. Ac-20365]MBN3761325.1 hypothetical protein [Burkholderia sp. Ac-20365]
MSLIKEALETSARSEVIGALTALVTGVLGFALRYHRTAVRKQKEKFAVAASDIGFLLALEEEYRSMLKEHGIRLSKVEMRDRVRARGLLFSGRFTPGRVAAAREARGFMTAWYRFRATVESMPEQSETS